jgi:hypothetical protein
MGRTTAHCVEIRALPGHLAGHQRRIAMAAGTILVTALLVLCSQVMAPAADGTRPKITLASQFGIPADRAFTDWPFVDQAIHAVVNDIPIWFLLVLVAAVIYWLIDWTDEKLGLLFSRRTPPAAEAERKGERAAAGSAPHA